MTGTLRTSFLVADPVVAASDAMDGRLDVLRINLRTLAAAQIGAAEREAALRCEIAALQAALAKSSAASAVAQARPVAATRQGKRGRAAVVSWDLCHNPVGRAMVIHDLLAQDWDVELVGPQWKRFGSAIWAPIANGGRKVRGFPCETLEQFWPAAQAFAASADYDLIVVCKPRLPALVLGALLQRQSACPMVLDVDDFELSFFKDETPATLDDLAAAPAQTLREPYEELATRACDSIIREAGAVTVSNAALRQRYGGFVVRHARDENVFHPDRHDRAEMRAQMGIAAQDFALVFVGTPRPHKGVGEIARVLNGLADKRFAFHIVGAMNLQMKRELDRYPDARIVLHPGCDFEDLPKRILAADAVVLLQDPGHPISQYQIPAKVSDAAAFGLPVLTTDVPPLRDLAHQGIVTQIDPADLAAHLMALAQARDDGTAVGQAAHVRAGFEAELGLQVNRQRLDHAIARAMTLPPTLPPAFDRLLQITARACAELRRPAAAPARSRAVVADPIDLVMFWKQNDSGLYGRRSDMLMKHFLASGRVRRILQFDAPMEVGALGQLALTGAGAASPASLVLGNTLDNQLGLRDQPDHICRTYLWDRRAKANRTLPGIGGSLADYPAYVAAQMQAAGITPERAVAWVCPVAFDFPAIASAIPFRAIVGDLIDDQRTMPAQPAYRRKIVDSYEATLPLFDLTFTNCAPNAEAFGTLARDIHVVPNGAELPQAQDAALPAVLQGLPRPIAGYVGNLRDRIDWVLLHTVALSMPDVTFAIVGGGDRPEDTASLRQLPNVRFCGVVPYEMVQPVIAAFDVALLPHQTTELTNRMNPLKIYNYFAAAKPIVSTPVANIDAEITPYIRFGDTAETFAQSLRGALQDGLVVDANYDAVVEGITWNSRANRILDIVQAHLAKGRRQGG